MSNNLQIVNYDNSQVELIKKTVAIGATDLELQLFISQCKRTGLDALTRQIYFIKGKDGKVQIQTSIDGFRLVAERSGEYEGQTCPQWCGKDGVWKDVWLSNDLPSAARVGVYKKNFREALYGIALFDEYAQRKNDGSLNYMWDRMPALMISKVAESLALRKAFPNDLSGLYTIEEMGQAERPKEEKVVNGFTNVNAQTKSEARKVIPQTLGTISSTFPPTVVVRTMGGEQGAVNEPSNSIPPAQEPNFNFDGANAFSKSEPPVMETVARPSESAQEIHMESEAYRIDFGKHQGKSLRELGAHQVRSYANYLKDSAESSGKPMAGKASTFVKHAEFFLSRQPG